jgi:hypothetical protein
MGIDDTDEEGKRGRTADEGEEGSLNLPGRTMNSQYRMIYLPSRTMYSKYRTIYLGVER